MTETAESNLHHEFYAPETSVAGTTALDEMNIISSTPAAAAEQVDGIEILVNMAKTGKVDPWNVDIVDITDKYLSLIHI